MRTLLPLSLLLAAAGCGESMKQDEVRRGVEDQQAARHETDRADPGTLPVRIGELGPNFGACPWVGTTRTANPALAGPLDVRAAPSEIAATVGSVPADARFFICSRSLDQRWLGIIWEEGGTLAAHCAVSRPLPARRNYEGPCRSGWVSAALVKQIAG